MLRFLVGIRLYVAASVTAFSLTKYIYYPSFYFVNAETLVTAKVYWDLGEQNKRKSKREISSSSVFEEESSSWAWAVSRIRTMLARHAR